jgi:hypothetical protein
MLSLTIIRPTSSNDCRNPDVARSPSEPKVFPVIRTGREGRRSLSLQSRRSIAVYADGIVLFALKAGYILPETCYLEGGAPALFKAEGVKYAVHIPVTEVRQITLRQTEVFTVDGSLQTANGTKHFGVGLYETKRLLAALEALVPGRIVSKLPKIREPHEGSVFGKSILPGGQGRNSTLSFSGLGVDATHPDDPGVDCGVRRFAMGCTEVLAKYRAHLAMAADLGWQHRSWI